MSHIDQLVPNSTPYLSTVYTLRYGVRSISTLLMNKCKLLLRRWIECDIDDNKRQMEIEGEQVKTGSITRQSPMIRITCNCQESIGGEESK